MARVTINPNPSNLSVSAGSGTTKESDLVYNVSNAGVINVSCDVNLLPSRNWYCKKTGVAHQYTQYDREVLFYEPTGTFYVYGEYKEGCKINVYLKNGKSTSYTIPQNIKYYPYTIPSANKGSDILYYDVVCGDCMFTYPVGSERKCDSEHWSTDKTTSPHLRILGCEKKGTATAFTFEARPTNSRNVLSILSKDKKYTRRVFSNLPCGVNVVLTEHCWHNDSDGYDVGWINLTQPDISVTVKVLCCL